MIRLRGNLFSLVSNVAASVLKTLRANVAAMGFGRFKGATRTRLRRASAIGLMLSGMFVIALGEPSGQAVEKLLKSKIAAALADPLALFAARSPGPRPSGELQLAKGAGRPHERVLSTIRDREPPSELAPVTDPSANPDVVGENNLPGESQFVGQNTVGPPLANHFLYASQGVPVPSFSGDRSGGGQTGGDPAAGDTAVANMDIPEPQPWTFMAFGFLMIVAARSLRPRIASGCSFISALRQ